MSQQVLLEKLTKGFSEEAAEGVNALYTFKVGETTYNLQIKEGSYQILEAPSNQPDVTLSAKEETWKDILNGDLAAQMAFLTGKLTVEGDFSLAIKLPQIFSL